MVNPKAHRPAGATLRFVALGGSIASDWDNPIATSARAVLAALADAGHDVTFLERRGNPWLAALLKTRGSRPLKAFTDRYPQIQYRTYDLPSGWQRTVWFGREVGTADAIIALPGTPPELLPEIAAMPPRHIVSLVDESLPIGHADIRLVRAGSVLSDGVLPFGPAVTVQRGRDTDRILRPLIVAYDDAAEAELLADTLIDLMPERVVTGTSDLPGWTYVPEVELPDWYARYGAAVISGAGDSPWSEARRLLPLASGCASVRPSPEGTTAIALRGTVAQAVPGDLAAERQAEKIVLAVEARRLR